MFSVLIAIFMAMVSPSHSHHGSSHPTTATAGQDTTGNDGTGGDNGHIPPGH